MEQGLGWGRLTAGQVYLTESKGAFQALEETDKFILIFPICEVKCFRFGLFRIYTG
jgi:hypothetical protein